MPPFTKFICTECGHSEVPCKHWWESKDSQRFKFIESALCEIIHILNRPQSATLRLQPNQPVLVGGAMPKTIPIGGTASSVFQEWSGPNGTGQVVPDAGPIAYSSDNTAVATVDSNTGFATGVGAGTANISGKDTVDNLVGSDVLTVTPPPVSATLTLQ
jgi:hypothetical protein